MLFNESFWVAVSITLFFLLVFKKLKAAANNILSTRIDSIETKFKEIEAISKEAENLLNEYKQLKKTAKSKAQEILKNAELEINQLKENAEQEFSYKLKVKTENIQNKIGNLEDKTLSDLRIAALNLAISSSIVILKTSDIKFSQEMIDIPKAFQKLADEIVSGLL